MINLSVVINTKNSASTLENTLRSVKSWADEIVVVDMNSTDETLAIASKFTDCIFSHQDVDYVEPARNFAISQANGIWVLVLDSDEVVGPKLKEKILQLIKADTADCYYLPRKNLIFGQWIKHTGWWPDYVLRLFKKEYVTWTEEIHSLPITTGKVEELPAKEELAIEHHNYQQISQFISRLNRYTTVQAKSVTDFTPESIIHSFKNEFFSRYFFSQGYLDGTYGLALSFLQSFSEVVRVLKGWENQRFLDNNQPDQAIDELDVFSRELKYWVMTYRINHSRGLMKIWYRIKRRFNW